MGEGTALGPLAGSFGQVVMEWRRRRRMSQTALAREMGFDRSYVAHVEADRVVPSAKFAQLAEQALNADGQIWRARLEATGGDDGAVPVTARGASGLVVELDHAELVYDGATFTATMRRTIVNAGPHPVTRYLARISVDRHPGDPVASNRLYRAHPLTFEELTLVAHCDGEPMTWQCKSDKDSFKEVWLLFENAQKRFPLYPGQRCTLAYSYRVSDQLWGPWFQRAIRLPTLLVSVRLVFPADLDAKLWGIETSATAEAITMQTPIVHCREGDRDVFDWETSNPQDGARYRIEWHLRGRVDGGHPRPELRLASDRMKAAGIIQRGDPILTRPAQPFTLPAQAAQARELVDELLAAMQRVREHHEFGKGMGLAAPQIGISRAAAIIQPPGDDQEPLVLLNPRVVEESGATDEQYEGCLSFFDVRGLTIRPLRLEVEHTTLDAHKTITVFHDGLARLVAHEVDHLHGRLYLTRMRDGVDPISIRDYKGTGQQWHYRTR